MKEGWINKRFDEVFNLQMGKTPDRKNPKLFEGNNIWVTIRDLENKYIHTSSEFISDEAATNMQIVKSGTVIMSFKLTVGKCAIAATDLYTNEAIMAFYPKDGYEINPSFLYYYLRHYKWEGMNKAVMGITLNKASISKQLVSIPLLIDEQEKIAAELDLLTDIIGKQKTQLKELDTLASSIFYDVFGNPDTNEKGWGKKLLGDICAKKKDIQRAAKIYNKNDNILYIDISSIDNIHNVMTSPTPYTFGEAPSRAQQVVIKNDVLISLVRPNLKNVAIVSMNEDNLVASSGFCVLRAKKGLTAEFLFFVVKMDSFTDYLMQRVSGANYPAVREEDIKGYSSIVPPLSLQQSFAEKIEAIERQKANINASIAETQKLFDYTMDKYFG